MFESLTDFMVCGDLRRKESLKPGIQRGPHVFDGRRSPHDTGTPPFEVGVVLNIRQNLRPVYATP